jgi:clan AA aspartic protease (TIGR02281 family)
MTPENLTIGFPETPALEPEMTEPTAATAVLDEPPAERPVLPLSEIDCLDDYLRSYGKILGKQAITALQPLHVPGRDPLPDFSDLLREPFEPQKHVIAAAIGMMDNVGNGFIVGTMGTGKTILGMSAVYKHAQRSRAKGGSNGKFRCIVLCPDHLIAKWEREIKETIPDVVVHRFDTWKGLVGLLSHGNGHRWAKTDGPEFYVIGRNQAKWYPDWTGLSDPKRGISGHLRQDSISSKSVVIDRVPMLNEFGRPMYNKRGEPVMKNITARVHYCPACGAVPRDRKGAILDAKALSKKQVNCSGRHLQSLPVLDMKGQNGRDRVRLPSKHAAALPGTEVNHGGRKWVVKECGEPLWNWTSKPYRWAPARIIHKKLKRFFDYLIIDEVHEQKSDESAQSMAAGKLIASVKHTLALTGTIIGGYANHLYPLMIRMNPTSLRREGFEWGKDLAFSEVYGRIDRIITTKEGDPSPTVGKNVKSMRRAKGGASSEKKYVRPGIMPTMFGKHLLGSSMFITLEELADELPDLDEFVADGACEMLPEQEAEYKRITAIMEAANRELLKKGSMKFLGSYLWTTMDYPDRPFGWGHDPEVARALEGDKKDEAPGLLGQSFLGRFDHKFEADTATLILTRQGEGGTETDRIPLTKDGGIYWLDVTFNGTTTRKLAYDTGASSILLPAGMAAEIGLKPRKGDESVLVQVADGSTVPARVTTIASVKVGRFTARDVEATVLPPGKMPHTVGYWIKPNDKNLDNWHGVVTPADLPEDEVYPKEQKLIDICKAEKKAGTQVWVYVQMTCKRNLQPRLKALLEKEGLTVGVLRSGDVDPKEREDWIAQHGREFDVMLSHPKLVSTGLDLFSKVQGGHNYATIVFYETGYNLFDMRQAARRAWRIGQPKDCKVYYLYYRETMQHRAMQLMSRKMAAAQALEGEFSAEGLAAMAGEENGQMALAKSLAERIDAADMQRSWSKVKSGGKKKITKPGDGLTVLAPSGPVKPSPLDGLPIELQLAGEAIIESQLRAAAEEADATVTKMVTVEPEPEPGVVILTDTDAADAEPGVLIRA